MNKKKILVVFIILMIMIFALMTKLDFYMMSWGDYKLQTLPYLEYIRANIWSTGDLFPQLNMNYGMIQSYADFYYYGLYNPFLIFSVLVPFLPTYIYLEILVMIIMIFQFLIGYKIIKDKKTTENIAIFGAMLVACFGFVLRISAYHSMFSTSYVGFLLLILGIKELVYEEKKVKIVVGSILIFATNFTFILAYGAFAGIYLIYLLIKEEKKIQDFTKFSLIIILLEFLAMAISGFFLFPQLNLILSGARFEIPNVDYSFLHTFTDFHKYIAEGIFVGPFTMLVILLAIKYRKKEYTFALVAMAAITFFVPIFNFLQLFESSHHKVLMGGNIIFVVIFTALLSDLEGRNVNRLEIFSLFLSTLFIYEKPILSLIAVALSFGNKYFGNKVLIFSSIISAFKILLMMPIVNIILSQDMNFNVFFQAMFMLATIVVFFLLINKKKLFRYSVPVYMILAILGYVNFVNFNSAEVMEEYGKMESFDINNYDLYRDSHENNLIKLDETSSDQYTSLLNANYMNHFGKTADIQKNGIIINAIVPHTKITDILYAFNNEYEQFEVRPIIYGTSDVFSLEDYLSVDSSLRLVKELQGMYVESASGSSSTIDNYLEVIEVPESITKTVDKDKNLEFKNNFGNGELIIYFDVDPSLCFENNNSLVIAVNNQYNNLQSCQSHLYNANTTFTFYAPTVEQESISMYVKAGYYNLSNIHAYYLSDEAINEMSSNFTLVSDLQVDLNHSFTFNINMQQDGYIMTSIPYDEGYSVIIDGKEMPIERANVDFLSAPISKGEHSVVIEYHIPGFKIGWIATIVGTIILIYIYKGERRKNELT